MAIPSWYARFCYTVSTGNTQGADQHMSSVQWRYDNENCEQEDNRTDVEVGSTKARGKEEACRRKRVPMILSRALSGGGFTRFDCISCFSISREGGGCKTLATNHPHFQEDETANPETKDLQKQSEKPKPQMNNEKSTGAAKKPAGLRKTN